MAYLDKKIEIFEIFLAKISQNFVKKYSIEGGGCIILI